ncbi:hypothetical protein LTR37_019170 [Vermiconidia calcicola]|uniref:Uncharacterized protein n=1 Tax=Vermiconidia calcicola TaxID=1690605 RepID=A0ACC3MF00_9PEZI|nr:hypothetical protein LTR37_019170 [Vermiconidia calcicola]
MASSNFIKNVAIVGAGGNSGSHMTKFLLETGKHNVTAITRADSKTKLPPGVNMKQVDYADPSTIVEALQGQDALVITLSTFAPPGQQETLFKAAADANVSWVLPNEWSPDSTHEGLIRDAIPFNHMPDARKKIEELGMSSYIAVSCGFWYEWSLAIPDAFGINIAKREATLIDDGETKMSISTWPQVGRAVAALLSLPIQPEGGDQWRCLDRFRKRNVYVASFTISQRDMFESVFRVTGTKESDWKITHEPAEQRYKKGLEDMKKGDRSGFARQMYTRVFFKDESGNFEKRKGLQNELLGLPRENIDDATRAAEQRQKESPWA